MKTTVASETEQKLRTVFATFGLPKTVFSDNGPPFISKQLEMFFQINGIDHITSPPYHPMSNGEAENMVKTFKNAIKAAMEDHRNDNSPLETVISRFLLTYRNTPHTVKITF